MSEPREDPVTAIRYVFRAESGKSGDDRYYIAQTFAYTIDSDWHAEKGLSELADSIVKTQLKYLSEVDLTGDEHFPLNLNFNPPWDVRMQRSKFWRASSLSDIEKGEFLDCLHKSYLKQATDPISYESQYPDDCDII